MTNPPELPFQSQEDDFTSDLISTSSYEFDVPKKKNFLPWHRPRKQFVREKQWSEQISTLINEKFPETGTIKYLGLPGDDLLDLRYFHDNVCLPRDLKLKFLGFNNGIKAGSSNKDQIEISLDEVSRLPNVDAKSELLPDDLTTIALNKSIAWAKSSTMGPFDIINIDLCDGFAKQPLNDFKETHYNTLQRLMSLQARRPDPWLLLLTTRTDSEGVDNGVFERLKQIYIDNLIDCQTFLNDSIECFAVNNAEELEAYCSDSNGFSNIFLTSLCKWILKLGLEQNPPVKVEVKNAFGYKVAQNATSPDLISVAIKVIPTFDTVTDSIGLANQINTAPNECVLASRILRRINKQQDVDDILASNETLMADMLNGTKILLEQSRYDVTEFEAWARGAS